MKLILRQRSTPQWQGTGRDARIVSVGADRDVYLMGTTLVSFVYDWTREQWTRSERPDVPVAVAA